MKAEWAFSNDGINMTKMLPQKKLGEKPLKSLKISCLDNICKNITYWMGYLPENANKYLYVITPFDVLCSSDIMELLRRLVSMRLFKLIQFNLMLHQNLSEMELSPSTCGFVSAEYLRIMFNRSKKIKRLTIKHDSLPKILVDDIPARYHNLEHLHCQQRVSQRFLDTLMKNCNHLKSLHIDASDFEIGSMQSLPCRSINSLTLRNAKCDSPENTSLLLATVRAMPNLSRLSLHGSSLDFSALIDNGDIFSDDNILGLGLIHIQALDMSATFGLCDHSLSFILKSCSNLEDLNLSSVNLTSKVFKSIERLSRLVSLKVGYPQQASVLFDSNVEQCLMKIGATLNVLDLSEFKKIPIPLLSKCCRNLKELYLNESTFQIHRETIIPEGDDLVVCGRLHTLEIGSTVLKTHQRSRNENPANNLQDDLYVRRSSEQIRSFFIFPSNRLRQLRIGNCDERFLDSLFTHELADDLVSELIHLDASGNTSMTKPHVIRTLLACPQLTHFSLLNSGLTRQEICSLKRLVQDSRIVTELLFSS